MVSSASAPIAGVRTGAGGRQTPPAPLLMRKVSHLLRIYTTRAWNSIVTTGPFPMWTAGIWPNVWSG